jgi:spore germination protein YaaH
MRKKIMPVIVAVAFISIVILIALCTALVQKYRPSKEHVVLTEYYNIDSDDDMAVILDNKIMEESCKYIDGHAYLDFEFVQTNLNQRFYWDANENIMRYTTPSDVITVPAGGTEYQVTKEANKEDYTIVRVDGSSMYLAVDFVQKYTNIEYSIFQEPNRIMITSKWGEVQNSTIKKDTEIREKGGIKSSIVAELEKGTVVTVLSSGEDWSQVCTEDGMIGYLKNKRLNNIQTETKIRAFEEPEFKHLLKNEAINMVWHQVTTPEANDNLAEVLRPTKGVNVVSPTWFYLNDNNGNIKSLASSSYVNYCHQNGIEVWGLISNLENEEVDTTHVLNHTSIRDYLINQIIAAAIEYDLDGINLDFEALSSDAGDSYIQFVRELSIKCENNGIILSIDNYVPTEYTAFYNRAEQALFADYVVIMGYDEHYSGSEEGSVASIGFVTSGVEDTLKEVPANQIILGMPFYTRVWECVPKDTAEDSVEAAAEDYVPYDVNSSAVGMAEAESRYTANGAEKVWLEEVGQHYVEYVFEGNTYKIWLEDEASMEERLKVMKENSLAGAAFWKIGLEKNTIWDLVIKYIN